MPPAAALPPVPPVALEPVGVLEAPPEPMVDALCAKANDLELTNIGLELKVVVEQFREQVQNLE